MGVALYRSGDSHVQNDIKCEITVVPASAVKAMLADGWKKSPDETVTIAQKVIDAITPEEPRKDNSLKFWQRFFNK